MKQMELQQLRLQPRDLGGGGDVGWLFGGRRGCEESRGQRFGGQRDFGGGVVLLVGVEVVGVLLLLGLGGVGGVG